MFNLLGMLAAIAPSLSVDRDIYVVGQKPLYTITGAIPGSAIAWTSFKDNVQTGEFNAQYGGQEISANGTAEIEGAAFTAADVGRWQKQLLLIAPDGGQHLVQAFFVVRESMPQATAPQPASSGGGIGDFFNQSVSIGGVEIPYFLIAGGVALWFFSKRR